MKNVIKQVVGVDAAQKELVVCFGSMYDDLDIELRAYKTFPNTSKGFEELIGWANKLKEPLISVNYVMEATGVYHESFAYFFR